MIYESHQNSFAIGRIVNNTSLYIGPDADERETRIGNVDEFERAVPGNVILVGQKVLIRKDTIYTEHNPMNRIPITFQGMDGWVSAEDLIEDTVETNAWVNSKEANPTEEPNPLRVDRTPKEILEQDYRISMQDDRSPTWGMADSDLELKIVLAVVRKIATTIAEFIEDRGFPIHPVDAFRLMFTPLHFHRDSISPKNHWGTNPNGYEIIFWRMAFYGEDKDFSPGDLIAHELGHCFTWRYKDETTRHVNAVYHDGGHAIGGHQFYARSELATYEYLADALGNYWLDRLYDSPAGNQRRQRILEIMDIAVRDRLWSYGLATAFEQLEGNKFTPSARSIARLEELDDIIRNMREVFPRK